MPYEVVSSAWHKSHSQRSSCHAPLNRVGRKRKKGHGPSYNHYCVGVKIDSNGNVLTGYTDDMSYTSDTPKTHHPCLGLGESTLLGGGTDSDGNWPSYTGKSDNYNNAEFAFKCTIPDSKIEQNIKKWSSDPHMTTAGAKGDNGFKNLWSQIVFGMNNPHITQVNGYCSKVENLTKEVYSDGRQCKDAISEALAKAMGKQYCKNYPTDERCACINISDYGTAGCLSRPNLPGCKELKAGFDKFPGTAQTEIDVKLWTPLCFMTNPCPNSSQFKPDKTPEACKQTIAICKQEQNLYADTVAAGAKINFKSEMECKAETVQDAPTATTPPSGSTTPPSGDEEEEEIKIPKSVDEFKKFFPKNIDELKTSKKKQIGVGGVVFIIMIIMAIVGIVGIAAASGDGSTAPVKRRFR